MSESILVAIISPVSALLGVFLTQYFNRRNEKIKQSREERAELLRVKRSKLDSIYKELIRIIDSFPNKTPADVLEYLEASPNYSLENFDTINKILDIQIKDYEDKLSRRGLSYDLKSQYEVEINNRKYYKQQITEIKTSYFYAKEEYERFSKEEKIEFELYAGQKVKNALVDFDIVWHNAFIAGRRLEYDKNNNLNNVRWKLINSIREDLEIY